LSVTDIPLYRRVYAPLLADLRALAGRCLERADGETAEACALPRAQPALESLLQAHAGTVCALILEPLVQCAGGMRMHHPAYLRRARALCDAHGVDLIADEIAVGFGRTGTLFACEQAGHPARPVVPVEGPHRRLHAAVTPCSPRRRCTTDFLDDTRERAFLHSHSYTGNPLACKRWT
jgi:adenosylmethionine-8-amino-7-oxononanoate aminotransferase